MTVQIPPLPTPVPQSTDPVNFAARADAFLAALPGFATAANQQADENNQLNASTVAAAASAREASDLALASISASRFDPNSTYPAGVLVWSPIDGKTYRRKVAGKAAADPSGDAVNWMRQVLTKADFGLGNVDNTSDADKPVSTAMLAALNSKETPAGALMQMQGFGLGAGTGPITNDLNALRAGGMYVGTVASSASAGLPVAVGHSVLHIPGSSGSAQQLASPITTAGANRRRVWHRQMIADGWSAWREIAFLDDPAFTGVPTAPTPAVGTNTTQIQTTAGALAQIKAFGLGQDKFGDATAGNPKVWPNAIGNTSPTQFITAEMTDDQALSGQPVVGGDFSGLSISRVLRPVQFGVNGRGPSAQFWYRGYSAAVPIQSEWNRLAEREDGTFTPILEGSTTAGAPIYVARFGRYTRVANRVLWTCRISLSSIGGMLGSLRLGGFPFVVANAGGAEGSIAVGFFQGMNASVEIAGMSGLHRVAANNANIYRTVPSAKNSQALAIADISDAFTIYASGQYEI